MSLENTYANNVKRKRDELIRLQDEKAKYSKNRSDASQKILRAERQLKNIKSKSMINSKMNEISRESKKKSEAEKKISECDTKIAKKEKELAAEEVKLLREQEKSQKKRESEIRSNYTQLQSDMNMQKSNTELLYQEIRELKKPKEKISILFLGANPDIINQEGSEQSKLKLDKEAREIKESLTKSLNRDSINFETRWAVRTSDLFQAINEVNPTIIHFSGHGTEDGKLVLQDNTDKPKLVDIESIVKMIDASTDNLRLAVFNNCFSSQFAEYVVDSIEASIGMNDSISDEAAIIFASQLYSAIGFGNSLEKAFNQAKARLLLEGINEDTTPELYVNENFKSSDIYIVKND